MKQAAQRILTDEILQNIRKHEAGTNGLKRRALRCHYCNHKEVEIFEDARGHVKAKCGKCGHEAIYNVAFCRNGAVRFKLLTL